MNYNCRYTVNRVLKINHLIGDYVRHIIRIMSLIYFSVGVVCVCVSFVCIMMGYNIVILKCVYMLCNNCTLSLSLYFFLCVQLPTLTAAALLAHHHHHHRYISKTIRVVGLYRYYVGV